MKIIFKIVRDVFSAYTDAEITDTTLKDFLMQVSFTFRGFALKLNIVHPENAYLREVLCYLIVSLFILLKNVSVMLPCTHCIV